MSQPSSDRLASHKASVGETLQGLVSTFGGLPGLLHGDADRELAAATAGAASREAAHDATRSRLEASLPAELTRFDQVLDDVLARSQDLSASLIELRGFASRPQPHPPAKPS